MQVNYYHIDAFTERVFGGNPAGVCRLEDEQPKEILQKIARENNHSETAFFIRKPDGAYDLRWFTPTVEVDLCGHATLAAAHVLWRHEGETGKTITFHTKSGPLTVTRNDQELIAMDFPSRPAQPALSPCDVKLAFPVEPLSCWKARDYLFEFADEETVRTLEPDILRLAGWTDAFGVIVTAPGREVDFVSRFFAPCRGVPEDPVTGSAHCTLVPFWAERLGKAVLQARQVSRRGGELLCEARGDRVLIAGHAVTYLKGVLEIEGTVIARRDASRT
jgi:PhzF family phenazine biosynthesis protein